MRIFFFIAILTSLYSCEKADANLQALDLLSQGLPLKIQAPPNVEITSSDLGIIKDVTVKNKEGYSIQIFESEAKSLQVGSLLGDLKTQIEASKYFSKILTEDESGFIFEKKVDENYINYDFRHIKIRGDKQYVIQAGLSNQYTKDQVEIMYRSVQ